MIICIEAMFHTFIKAGYSSVYLAGKIDLLLCIWKGDPNEGLRDIVSWLSELELM